MTTLFARIFSALTLSSALGCGLVAGIFFAFSTFVMTALSRLPPAQGIAAMQSINVVVLNRWFLGVFCGTALTSLALIVPAALRWSEPSAKLAIAGALLYFAGTFIFTLAYNVPRNDVLAAIAPDAPESVAVWRTYLVEWVNGNHVRTLAAFVASALMTIALFIERAKP